jgi:beta-lactamase class A
MRGVNSPQPPPSDPASLPHQSASLPSPSNGGHAAHAAPPTLAGAFPTSLVTQLETLAGQARRASTGELAVAVTDLVGRRGWGFQSDERRPAASIIKVPILVELYARAQAGDLDLDERVELRDADKVGGAGVLTELAPGLCPTWRDLGTLMTIISDNTASNLLIERLGFEAINTRMAHLGMPASVLGRKFMIDPAALHAKNFVSARDMASCLAAIYQGSALGPAATAQVLDILSRQQYREKIPLLLPEEVRVAHKTGEISGTRHDAAIVFAERPYVLVCMTWEVADVLAADRAIAQLSRQIYDLVGTEGKLSSP